MILVPETRAACFALNVDQSALDNAPRFEALAVGKLNVWVEPAEFIAKSVPVVPVAKVWVESVKPFNELNPIA